VAPTEFSEGAEANNIQMAQLDDGNLAIVYADVTDSSFGKMCIRSSTTGAVVHACTTFEGAPISTHAKPVVMTNGNVFIVYVQSGGGLPSRFTIMSPANVVVKAPTDIGIFETNVAGCWETSGGFIFVGATVLPDKRVDVLTYDINGNVIKSQETAAGVFDTGNAMTVGAFGDSMNLITFDTIAGTSLNISIERYAYSFLAPADIVTNKRLIAFANDTLFYEDI
jgi:hypothetical protein